MDNGPDLLPDDVAALRAELIAARAKGAQIEAELAVAKAKASEDLAVIARQKLRIEKLERQLYGPKAERRARLIDQMEFQLAELEMAATEDELAAEMAAAAAVNVAGFTRSRPVKKPFPDDLPRERVVVPGPVSCQCCGGDRLRKLGEDITETLEIIPRQWKVIQTVREKSTCRDCEKISQAPAPFHAIPRGWAGPNLLAMICSTSSASICRSIVRSSTRRRISPAVAAFCRRTPIPATPSSIFRIDGPAR
ncbi:IS66 family transposase zinc-finger binding domain-containing protein (plasmid) [Sinorhizobium numidicum]|nr:IS66 family transposase zinc-finger binding domain-containing protein [Sinorhizobium numidicum]WEX79676.1 IS66 family transposase zinc-finger binding domain-containing protein [Sinorhizobium numidicum]